MNNKVVPLESLANVGGVLCHGCFDLVHLGHLRYFSWARNLLQPEYPLIVTITADACFPKYKGEKRPAFNEDTRAEWLSHIALIDYVSIVYEPTGVLAINTIKPRIYAKGHEAQGVIPLEVAATEAHGGRVVYMEKESVNGQIYSSGRILSGEYLRSRGPRGVGDGDYGVE